ncbi:hypothetical protein ACQP1K_25505 [Sphaerimonospora sp. CA-214678]|uniref:hypothetical protein n=1 Tax=Sphaerimonospora sp. CA-214678 TaxID=3240029 RepID=UPI003D904DF1
MTATAGTATTATSDAAPGTARLAPPGLLGRAVIPGRPITPMCVMPANQRRNG